MNKRTKIKFGAYCDSQNIRGEKIIETIGLKDVLSLEAVTDIKLSSIMWYPTWNAPDADENFPHEAVKIVCSHNSVAHIVWELCMPGANPCADSILLKDVLSGKYDRYISKYARAAKNCGETIFLRFLHEFNGTWYSWSGIRNEKNPVIISSAWKHVVKIFRNEGADNVKWIWSPNGICGGTPDSNGWNRIENYWPGSEYVDMIGLDAYNFFPFFDVPQPLSTFHDCFAEAYSQCLEFAPETMKFMIAETACGEFSAPGMPVSCKADWIKDAVSSLESTAFQRVEWFFWFNVCKELDWRADSSPESLEAFKSIKRLL